GPASSTTARRRSSGSSGTSGSARWPPRWTRNWRNWPPRRRADGPPGAFDGRGSAPRPRQTTTWTRSSMDRDFNLPFAQKSAAIAKSPFETFGYMAWDLQQLQDAFLHRRQGTHRTVAYPVGFHDPQVQSSEGGQQQFRAGSARTPSRLAGVHPAQLLPTGGQVATHHVLHQRQHPQTETQQVHQTRHSAVDLQVHRREAQRLALEPGEAVLDPILTAITQHRPVQRQPRLVGHVDAPTILLFLDLDSGSIDLHQHADLPKHHHVRRTVSVPASGAFRPDRLHSHV